MKNKTNFKIKETGAEIQIISLTAREYYDLTKKSISILEDFSYSLSLNYRFDNLENFDFPEIYAALRTLFGESTTMYDNYKCSFGFLFHIIISKNNEKFEYLLNFTDIKGGISFLFKKILITADEIEQYKDLNILHKPIEKEFSKKEMQYFMDWFTFYLKGFMSVYKKDYNQEFIRGNKSAFLIYGYINSNFFMSQFETEDEYYTKIADFIKNNKNIKFNDVKENK